MNFACGEQICYMGNEPTWFLCLHIVYAIYQISCSLHMACNTAIKVHVAARCRSRRKTVREEYVCNIIFTRAKKSIITFYLVFENRKTLHPCVNIIILPQVSEKTQHCKVIRNVTNLPRKKGSSVVPWHVCCKILLVLLQLAEKTFKFLLSISPFLISLPTPPPPTPPPPQFVPYTLCSGCLHFFPHSVLYLSIKHQNGTLLKMQWGCLLNSVKRLN